MTTTSFGTSVSGGVTRTTTTKVTSTCATITGCNFKDADATKTVEGCEFTPAAAPRLASSEDKRSKLQERATEPDWSCDSDPMDFFIIPRTKVDSGAPGEREKILGFLDSRKKALGEKDGAYYEARIDWLHMTALYYVPNMGRKGRRFLKKKYVEEVRGCFSFCFLTLLY
jgi:hypothetical protein